MTSLIGCSLCAGSESLLAAARRAAGLSQGLLAERAGTSRPTLSAYERGRKSPSLSTAERILSEAGFELALRKRVEFVERPGERGRTVFVPTALPRLSVEKAMASVVLPLHLNQRGAAPAPELVGAGATV